MKRKQKATSKEKVNVEESKHMGAGWTSSETKPTAQGGTRFKHTLQPCSIG